MAFWKWKGGKNKRAFKAFGGKNFRARDFYRALKKFKFLGGETLDYLGN